MKKYERGPKYSGTKQHGVRSVTDRIDANGGQCFCGQIDFLYGCFSFCLCWSLVRGVIEAQISLHQNITRHGNNNGNRDTHAIIPVAQVLEKYEKTNEKICAKL